MIDILSDSRSAGKPTGRDTAKGKMTLPAILMLKNNPACFTKLKESLENDDFACLKTMLIESSSIRLSQETICRLVREGVDSIESIRGNPSGKLLVELAEQLSKPI